MRNEPNSQKSPESQDRDIGERMTPLEISPRNQLPKGSLEALTVEMRKLQDSESRDIERFQAASALELPPRKPEGRQQGLYPPPPFWVNPYAPFPPPWLFPQYPLSSIRQRGFLKPFEAMMPQGPMMPVGGGFPHFSLNPYDLQGWTPFPQSQWPESPNQNTSRVQATPTPKQHKQGSPLSDDSSDSNQEHNERDQKSQESSSSSLLRKRGALPLPEGSSDDPNEPGSLKAPKKEETLPKSPENLRESPISLISKIERGFEIKKEDITSKDMGFIRNYSRIIGYPLKTTQRNTHLGYFISVCKVEGCPVSIVIRKFKLMTPPRVQHNH